MTKMVYFSYCITHSISLSSLGENDHHDIKKEMISVVAKWEAIGRGLGIDCGRLELIKEDNPGDATKRFSAILTCWLQRRYNVERFGKPTWRAVVKVVADPAAGDNYALTLSIAEQHSGNSSNHQFVCTDKCL